LLHIEFLNFVISSISILELRKKKKIIGKKEWRRYWSEDGYDVFGLFLHWSFCISFLWSNIWCTNSLVYFLLFLIFLFVCLFIFYFKVILNPLSYGHYLCQIWPLWLFV